jgi:predicted transposase/invertase (TIGR01784 family)
MFPSSFYLLNLVSTQLFPYNQICPQSIPQPPVRRDAIFYHLFKRHPALLPEYRFESVEIKEPSFRIDGVFLPPEEASPKTLFFTEVQFQSDPSLYHRFFAELFLYLYRNRGSYDDWRGVLLFPQQSLEPDDSSSHRELLESDRVQRLYLEQLSSTQESSIGISLVQLTVEPPEQTVEQAKRLIERARQPTVAPLSESEIIDIVTTIVAYKFTNLSREQVEAMLGITIEQTRIYQEAKAEGRQEGRQEGELRGKLQMVPLLVEAGLSIEEIATRIDIDVETVRQAARTEQTDS